MRGCTPICAACGEEITGRAWLTPVWLTPPPMDAADGLSASTAGDLPALQGKTVVTHATDDCKTWARMEQRRSFSRTASE